MSWFLSSLIEFIPLLVNRIKINMLYICFQNLIQIILSFTGILLIYIRTK